MGKSVLRHIMKTFIVLAASAIAPASASRMTRLLPCALSAPPLVPSLRRPQLSVIMMVALLQAGGGARERVRARARDRRSAPLSKMSGTRCRRRWEMSCVSSSRLAGWTRALSLIMPLPWLTLLHCLRRSMALDVNDMGECVESVMEYMGEDKKMAKCWDKYSEEDQEALMGIGYLTASIKCFLDGFMDACGEHVKTELMSAYFTQAAGRR